MNERVNRAAGADGTGDAALAEPVWPGTSGKGGSIEAVDFEALAHVLANACRWGGRTRRFYSYAQHAVIVSEETESLGGPKPDRRRLALCALLADAGACWQGDIQAGAPDPSRQSERARRRREEIDRALREAAGLTAGPTREEAELMRFVKHMVEAAERRDFPDAHIAPGAGTAFPAIRRRIRPLQPAKAARAWLARLRELTGPLPENGRAAEGAAVETAETHPPVPSTERMNDEGGRDDAGRDAA